MSPEVWRQQYENMTCKLVTFWIQKRLIKEVVNKKLKGSNLKHAAGSQPCELLSLTIPVENNRFQCSMSFKGDSVYFAENGLMTCNKAGTGFLNLTLRVQHDRPQTLLFCTTRPSTKITGQLPTSRYPPLKLQSLHVKYAFGAKAMHKLTVNI